MTHTKLATIAGIDLYEHEQYGDESPMLIKYKGKFYSSTHYMDFDIDPIEIKQAYQSIVNGEGFLIGGQDNG
jgi:hypothetical protein